MGLGGFVAVATISTMDSFESLADQVDMPLLMVSLLKRAAWTVDIA